MQIDQQETGDRAAGAVTKSATQARQGVTLGVMRWVLAISITLAIVGVLIAYFIA